ncbi:hypothetical protein, partial [Yersinia pestis]
CSCQTANCFNKSKGVFITDPKLKALLNPQPSWGFSGHNKKASQAGGFFYVYARHTSSCMCVSRFHATRIIESVIIHKNYKAKVYDR